MNWISVIDSLPEETIRVLIINKYGAMEVDYIVDCGIEKIWACKLDREQNDVLYWMPLPSPPKYIE